MAQRRMFSLRVVDTDSFLDMSPTAQNLYFHLGMRADDDGFVSNPKKIMKITGAPEDDMKVLIAKNFIIPMATNGVCVITHWKTNNLIKSDRYTETVYKEEKARIIEKDGVYSIDLYGSKMVPEVEPQVRLGKDRLLGTDVRVEIVSSSEESEKTPARAPKYPHAKEVFGWFPKDLVEPSWKLNTTILQHSELLYLRGEAKVRSIIKFCQQNESDAFFPVWQDPTSLERNWNKIIKFADRNGL